MMLRSSVVRVLLSASLVLLAAVWPGPPADAQEAGQGAVVKVLASFEGPVDTERGFWRSNIGTRVSPEHSTHGRQSLLMYFSREDAALWSTTRAFDNDWSDYEKLKIDVFLDGIPLVFSIQLSDQEQNRYSIPFYFLRPGANTIEVNLEGAGQVLDLKQVSKLLLRKTRQTRGRAGCYFDSIRLTRGVADTVPAELTDMTELPRVIGNWVTNPSFEFGLDGWQFWGNFDWGDYRAGTARGRDAHSGTSCATIRSATLYRGRGGLACERVWVPREGRYRASVWVKGKQGAIFRMGLANASFAGAAVDVTVSESWQELSYLVTVADAAKPVRIWLYNVGMGTLYLDDVAFVAEGPAAESQTLSAVPAGAADVRLSGELMYVNGEPFFPLGIVGSASPDAELSQTPFNLVLASPGSAGLITFLDRCYAAGVMGLADLSESLRIHVPAAAASVADHLKTHPSVLGWLLCDEPDGEAHPVPPPEVRLARRRLIEAVGTDRPVLLRLTSEALSGFYQYQGLSDVLLVSVGGPVGQDPLDVTTVTHALSRARQPLKGRAPVWLVLHLREGTARDLEPIELSALTYMGVAHGARGILWEPFDYFTQRPELWKELLALAGELKELTPVLVGPTVNIITGTNKTTMHGTVRRHQDKLFLIIVNGSSDPQPGTRFSLEDVPESAPVQVLFEDRALALEKGVLTDDFEPYGRHVYVLTSSPGPPAPPPTETPAVTPEADEASP